MMPPSIQLELFPVDEGLDDEAAPFGQGYNGQLTPEDRESAVQSQEQGILQGSDEEPDEKAGDRVPVSELAMDGLDVERLTCLVREWLEPLYLTELGKRVRVKWNSRLQTTAGRAHYEEDCIELNPLLITVSDIAEIERTLKHELAHLVAYERCGKVQRRRLQPHGPEWQEACDDLGISGEARCHELELPGRQMRRRFVYDCPVCGDQIERVKRFRGHVACYDCCQKHGNGKYDQRFQLVETRL